MPSSSSLTAALRYLQELIASGRGAAPQVAEDLPALMRPKPQVSGGPGELLFSDSRFGASGIRPKPNPPPFTGRQPGEPIPNWNPPPPYIAGEAEAAARSGAQNLGGMGQPFGAGRGPGVGAVPPQVPGQPLSPLSYPRAPQFSVGPVGPTTLWGSMGPGTKSLAIGAPAAALGGASYLGGLDADLATKTQALLDANAQGSMAGTPKTPYEQLLEDYRTALNGDTTPGTVALQAPEVPDIRAMMPDLSRFAPGREGAITPEDRMSFLMAGLARGAQGAGDLDPGALLLQLGAGALGGSAAYDMASREQEGAFAKETRDWEYELAKLEATIAAQQSGLDLERYRADIAAQRDPSGGLTALQRARALAGMDAAIDPEEILQLFGGYSAYGPLLNAENSPLAAELTKVRTVEGLPKSAEAEVIFKHLCEQDPAGCRDTIARYRLTRGLSGK